MRAEISKSPPTFSDNFYASINGSVVGLQSEFARCGQKFWHLNAL